MIVIDISQTIGIEDINFNNSRIDILVGGTHKHLYGLPGLGFVIYKKGIELLPIYYGGMGKKANSMLQPLIYPESLEVGTYNSVALIVLQECLKVRSKELRCKEKEYEETLMEYAYNKLKNINGINLYMGTKSKRTAVFSFTLHDLDPTYIIGEYLRQGGIHVRTGLHCAPLLHKTLKTNKAGTVRVSFSAHNTIGEINDFIVQLISLLNEYYE